MINLIITYGIVIPVAFVLLNLGVFWVFTAIKTNFSRTLVEMTHDWLRFMKQGIPIPVDYKRFNERFPGEPVLVRPLFHAKEAKPLVK